MQLFHAFFNGFGHTFNAFNNSVFGHVGIVYAHAAVGFVIRIERIADNGSNFHFNAFMEYFFGAYAFRNGYPQEQAAFRMSPFNAFGEFFFHGFQDEVAAFFVQCLNFFNVFVKVVVFNVSIGNALVEIGSMQVGALFDFNKLFQNGMFCGNPA